MKLRSGILISALGIGLAGLLANDAATLGVGCAGTRRRPPPLRMRSGARSTGRSCSMNGASGAPIAARAADCGTEINLYLRAKVGFCNCATGVSDNADLDRVSDLELFSEEFVGLTDGRPVSVGRLKGRSRLYHVDIPYAAAARHVGDRLQR